jgi:hydroxyacylglutathione hydrolase
MTRCYILAGENAILIDGGMPALPRQSEPGHRFQVQLRRLPVRPDEIKLILITHAHFDHIGAVQSIQNMTGAKVACHLRDKERLEQNAMPLPPGMTPWGRITIAMLARMVPHLTILPFKIDLALGDEGLSLAEYGVSGQVVYTPGHTAGSVSILLDTGEAFVGDLAMNAFPLRLKPGLPIFAEDLPQVKESWRKLLKLGVKTVYPSHGKPFSIEIIRKVLVHP